jgi:rubrerythrin
MDALELAMQMEEDSEIFYRDLAKRTTDSGLRRIFMQFADDEVKHYQLFKKMRRAPVVFVATDLIKNAGNIFKEMIAQNALESLDISQLELYQTAMELERKSQKFYLEKAADPTDQKQNELFKKIAEEEEKHYFLLHNIYELVLRPQTWVENGEFVHLDDY